MPVVAPDRARAELGPKLGTQSESSMWVVGGQRGTLLVPRVCTGRMPESGTEAGT